jgi:hypothetical protein
MPETTMQGVSLFTKERGRNHDIFELAFNRSGIEIRRPGESARHLGWERVSEWEIEQLRGGVLLTLRGGGSVTSLVIPRWRVDDLDIVLRDVTASPGDTPPVPPGRIFGTEGSWDEPMPQMADAVALEFPPNHETDRVGTEMVGTLAWPAPANVDGVPDLEWPAEREDDLMTGAMDLDSVLEHVQPPAVTAPVTEQERVPVRTIQTTPMVVAPAPRVPDQPAPTDVVPARAARRRRAQRRAPLQRAGAVILLGLLATAIALVLAQSAGAIHLAFLGS